MSPTECAAVRPAPHMVPQINGNVAGKFPKVAVDVFVDKSAGANCVPRVMRSRILASLRGEGIEPLDLQSGITNDLPILNLLISAPGIHVVLTLPSSSGGERECVWRMHRSTARLGDAPARSVRDLTLDTCRDFARAYRHAARAR